MKKRETALYGLLFLFSVGFIFFGHRFAANNSKVFMGIVGMPKERYAVRVDMVLSEEESAGELGGMSIIETRREFSGTVMYGERRGEGIVATQKYDNVSGGRTPVPLREGDWVIVYHSAETDSYFSGDVIRLNVIIIAAAVFFLLIILMGKLKGLATIVALLFSVCSVFLIFVPSILAGHNVYLSALVICAFSVVITPYFIGGFNVKSLSSMIGSIVSVGVASALTAFLNAVMRITGGVDDETLSVLYILDPPIDLRAIVFAGIIIGALGATLDVSMSIASSIAEMYAVTEDKSFRALFRGGMNIGRDIMGAQTSTLVMAYIGGSLSVVLLLIAYQNSLYEMLNIEYVIIELLQSLVGGFTILFAIPSTAFISALMFSRKAAAREEIYL